MRLLSSRGWWLTGALGLACAAGCSPFGGGSFACTENAQCGANGTCASGFCAFPDPDCPSMLKYGESSGPKSGTCVGATNDVDAGIDADIPTPDGASCYGASLVHACFASPPTGAQNLTAGTLNTMTSTQCAKLVGANANAWCVIAGSSITVTGTLNVIGDRPLVLISTGTIDVNGTLDVASHRVGGVLGPASDVAGCNAGTAPTVQSGGAGGSLGGVGGAGAAAGNNGAAGVAGAKLTPTALRGGCPGQKGAGGGGGNGGHGGGALWLYAATGITVGGSINASGSSGDNAGVNSSSGGGAGGSGGYIGLESPSVTVSGSIFANGGAGGEGSGSFSTGNPGIDSPNVSTAANGGNGGSPTGTDGGDGSLGATLDGAPAAACSGCISGGGGGGGAGIIKVVPPQTTGGQLSPPAS